MTKRGLFSANVLSLELQLKCLFDEVGGVSLLSLLDVLAELPHDDQKIILKRFQEVIEKFLAKEIRVSSCTNGQLAELEDSLYEDIVSRIESHREKAAPAKLSLVTKSELPANNDPIDLAKKRAERTKPFIN